MRSILLGIIFCVSQTLSGNTIDSLNTMAEVEAFLIKEVDPYWKTVKVFRKDPNDTLGKYGKVYYKKFDYNKDGLTDLLINGHHFFVVMDEGNKFRSHTISYRNRISKEYLLKDIIQLDRMPALLVTIEANEDTLIFRNGGVVEYSKNLNHSMFDTICLDYNSSTVEHNYRLVILSNKLAVFIPNNYYNKGDTFVFTIQDSLFNLLIQALKHIRSNDDRILRSGFDYSNSDLYIRYKNKKSVLISTYGPSQRFALRNVLGIISKIESTGTKQYPNRYNYRR